MKQEKPYSIAGETGSERRSFLKLLLVCGGMLATGKLTEVFTEGRIVEERVLKNFKITETGAEITVRDTTGNNEILIIEKDEL